MKAKSKLAQNSQGSRKPATGTGRGRGKGRPFPPGVSGNPGGRPKTVKEVQDLASTYTVESVEALVATMRRCQGVEVEPGIFMGADWKEVRQAAVAILNRACGMPSQPIAGVPGAPLTLTAGEGLVSMLKALAGEKDPEAE